MKNFKVIFWLIAFFPLGLYFMFKETEWSNVAKSIIAIIGTFILGFAISSGGLSVLIAISGLTILFSAVMYFIYSIMRRRQKRTAVLLMIFGTLLLGFGSFQVHTETVEAERVAQEQKAEEERIEAERVAEEKRIEEERLAEEQKAKEKDIKKKTDIALRVLEKVEESPTEGNFKAAQTAVNNIPDGNSELKERIENVEDRVNEYIVELDAASALVETAESSQARTDYDVAYEAASALSIKSSTLDNKLARLDSSLTKVEEENAEKQRLAEEANKKAEDERLAKEKADQEATQAASSSSSSTQNESQSTPSTPASSEKMYVDQNGDGTIKGSVNGIYHTPGSTYYGRTKNVVQWFKTTSEAEAAGYRAPKR